MKVNAATFTDCCHCHQRRQAASCLSFLPFSYKEPGIWEESTKGTLAAPWTRFRGGVRRAASPHHQHAAALPPIPLPAGAKDSQEFPTSCCHSFGIQSRHSQRRCWETGSRDNQKCRVLKDDGERVRIKGSREGAGRVRQPGTWPLKNQLLKAVKCKFGEVRLQKKCSVEIQEEERNGLHKAIPEMWKQKHGKTWEKCEHLFLVWSHFF